MLEVRNLSVKIGSRLILKDVNFNIEEGLPSVLFGPNGSGKSTLLKAIMGFEGYIITRGEIVFKGKMLNDMPMEERVKMGLAIMYQHPPQIRGVKLSQIASFLSKDQGQIASLSKRLSLEGHLGRDINLGFQGGNETLGIIPDYSAKPGSCPS